MTYTFYIDQFLLYQFGMNYIVLLIMEEIYSSRISWKRKLLVSLAVSAGSVAILFFPFRNYYVKVIGLLLTESIILVRFSFPWMNCKNKVSMCLTTMLLSFISGSVLNFFQQRKVLHKTYMVILAISYVIYKASAGIFQRLRNENRRRILQVTFWFGEQAVTALGIPDSGNLLKAGKERMPVVVIENSCIQHIRKPERTFRIKYVTLGNPSGFLNGMRCDRMQINENGATYEYQQVILGIYEGNLANGKYQVILPSFQDLMKYQESRGFQKIFKKRLRVGGKEKCTLQQRKAIHIISGRKRMIGN